MEATKVSSEELLGKNESIESNKSERIGTAVLKSILDTRIGQMMALTLPTDTSRQQILSEIDKTPSFTKKLTSFLDYMIGQITSLSVEMNKFRTEIQSVTEPQNEGNSSYTDSGFSFESRINHIAEILSVDNDNIEAKIESLLSQAKRNNNNIKKQNEYDACASLLECKQGKLEESIKLLMTENEVLQRQVTQDRSLLIRQNEELRKQMRMNRYLINAESSDSESDIKINNSCKCKFHHYNKYDNSESSSENPEILTIKQKSTSLKNEKPLKKQAQTIKELQNMIEDLKQDADRIGCKFYKSHKSKKDYI